jgi:hypothetical protein
MFFRLLEYTSRCVIIHDTEIFECVVLTDLGCVK